MNARITGIEEHIELSAVMEKEIKKNKKGDPLLISLLKNLNI